MSITPPTTYDPASLVTAGGVYAGAPVLAAPVAVLAANHNLMRAYYGGTLAAAQWRRAGVVPAPGWANLAAWYVPADPDGRVVRVRVSARHTGGGSDGHLRASLGGAWATAVTVPTSGTSWSSYDIDVTPGSMARELVLASDSEEVTVAAVAAMRLPLSGSVDDIPAASGLAWVNTAALDDSEPLTDELLNRLLTAPAVLWDAQRLPLVTCAGTLIGGDPFDWNGPSTEPIILGDITVRAAMTVEVAALFIGPGTAALTVALDPWGSVLLTPGGTSLGAAPYTWSTAEFDVAPGRGVLQVVAGGSGAASRLHSLAISPKALP